MIVNITIPRVQMTNVEADIIVDAKGLISPIPILKAKKAIDRLNAGQVLGLLATDECAIYDVSKLVQKLDLKLLCMKETDGVIMFYIRK